MFTFLSDSLLLIVPQLLWQCPGIVARGAAVRGGAGRRAKPGEEIDYGMPITDPYNTNIIFDKHFVGAIFFQWDWIDYL